MGHAQVAEEEVDGQNKEADGWEGVNRKETTERKNVVSSTCTMTHLLVVEVISALSLSLSLCLSLSISLSLYLSVL